MRVIPVLDILKGQVVRGVAGQRDDYLPIVSQLCAGSEPLTVARAFRQCFGLDELYLADLDAITGRSAPAVLLYDCLRADGFRLMVDAGLRTAADIESGARACGLRLNEETIVAGLETLEVPQELGKLITERGADRVLFSLDLQAGQPLANRQTWATNDAFAILTKALAMGVRRVLILDLSSVGTGQGIAAEPLARRAIAAHPQLEVYVGGGVRNIDDLLQLQSIGVAGVLVASALHDIRITGNDLARLSCTKDH